MNENKHVYAAPSQRQLTGCARAAILLLSAFAALESEDVVAMESRGEKPVVYVVALADAPLDASPPSRAVMSDAFGTTIYAVAVASPSPEERAGTAPIPVTAPVARESEAPAEEIVAQAPKEQMSTQPLAPTSGLSAAPAAGTPTPANPRDQGPQPGSLGQIPPAAAAGQQSLQPNDALRQSVLALATSGGAIRALEQAKARPDVFSPVDIAQIEELSIRQEVRGGRDKVRSMTSSDRFDALDASIRKADEFDSRLPKTPEYAQVRASLAGDRTVAFAARGRMEDAVAAFESIPQQSEVSVEALAAVGEAYSYLQQPAKGEQVYRRAIEQSASVPADAATLGYQYGTHTRLIDLREGLFYALTDQNKYAQAQQVLDDIQHSLPPASEVHPWDVANDDYLRYYRLLAQFQIYEGQTSAGMAGLQRLEQQVPFNSEVRNAQADATLGMSQTRHARDMYSATLTDHPDNIESLAGLGRASLALGDYASARRINDAFDDTFPENGSVRSFKRDFAAYRAPVLSVDASGEHGNSVLADNQFSIDTTLYSPPIYDYWRVFAHTFYGYADTDIGNISRTRVGAGGDYRNGPLTVTGEVTRSMGGNGRTGGNGEVSFAFNDYVSASAGVDSDSNAIPWKAYVQHLWGKTAQFSLNFTDTERRSASVSYGAARYSDSNFNQEIALSGTQRVFTAPNQLVNLTLNLNTSSNTITNAAYFAPSRDYTAEVVAMHQWAMWRSGEKALVQRTYLIVGAYNQRGFGTSAEYGGRIEQAWTFSHDISLLYGVGVLSHAYDGSRETSVTAYAALTVPF
ncbi:poly-beta-1,6 N-acetyl-D-glucosamine export porin PgaA [Paraburkholderia adhaesiva]|uniref:poly-beta-1,6 N-acetyl-D-glucosamine export porin PgaA n=1 Tax=Paraburkholderia adhaesiva TaxID=2883244 RepID=UPI001F29D135|nr:poly-beta-1,6 N-acetyl-D-glucosamine export porin PgaA [Paraburkholderia adhaesiva]